MYLLVLDTPFSLDDIFESNLHISEKQLLYTNAFVFCKQSEKACADIFIFSDCGDTYTLDNGVVDFTGGAITTYGRSLPVTCNTGYEPIGGSRITCLSDGIWSTVTCEIIGMCCLLVLALMSDVSLENINKLALTNKVAFRCIE